MDEDRHTAPSDFRERPGYKYYELKQKFTAQVKQLTTFQFLKDNQELASKRGWS
jgi:hypothetical protein